MKPIALPPYGDCSCPEPDQQQQKSCGCERCPHCKKLIKKEYFEQHTVDCLLRQTRESLLDLDR